MMKILFVAANKNIDYLKDCIFHGLSECANTDIFLANDLWYMFEGNAPEAIKTLYGKGFSIANRISRDRKKVEKKEDIEKKIDDRFYDLIIYGSIFRCDDYLDLVLKRYKKNEIIFLDGEDYNFDILYSMKLGKGLSCSTMLETCKKRKKAIELSQKGIYFKRELRNEDYNFFIPISFSIPEELVIDSITKKERKVADIIPGKIETYKYDTEREYFEGYQRSMWGVTCKKGGWDCMRHYEILANGCIPYFFDIEKCPSTTMVNFPKSIILETNRMFHKKVSLNEYMYFAEMLLEYTRENLTTRRVAGMMLSYI